MKLIESFLVGLAVASFMMLIFIMYNLNYIGDRLDYATIGGHRVPALECQEDELITWGQAKLACAPIEYYPGGGVVTTRTITVAELTLMKERRDAFEAERDQLREQNKALLETLRGLLPELLSAQEARGGYYAIIERVRAVIAQTEARGGSRADGPLLREPGSCSRCSGRITIDDLCWGTCVACGLKQQAYPSSEEQSDA